MNWEVFRAYDIRGIYPTDIDEEAYYRIAKAYVYLFKPKSMVVGMDADFLAAVESEPDQRLPRCWR